jgi:ABC-2 type transport system ATP-binding protein
MQEAEAVCDKVVIISKGKIVADNCIDALSAGYPGKSLEDIFIHLTSPDPAVQV